MEEVKEANLSDDKNVEIKKKEVKEINEFCKIINIYESTELEFDSNEDGVKGRIKFFKNYMTKEDADALYKDLAKDLKWEQKESTNFVGEKYPEPRLTFWYGRPYKYSKVSWPQNEDWYPKLKELKSALDNDNQLSPDPHRELNSVMCNYYRDNRDSIGWHADDETSLGRCPRIASISLGDTRVFEVCKREEYYNRFGQPNLNQSVFAGCTLLYKFHLGNGSLLFMEGSIQDNWLHRVPKESKGINGRINLTFRYIVDKEEEVEEIKYKKKNRKQRELIIQRIHATNNNNNGYKDEQRKYNNGEMIQNKLSYRNYNNRINQGNGKKIRRKYKNNKRYIRVNNGQDDYDNPRKHKYDNTSSDKKQENNDDSKRELTNYQKDLQSEQQRKKRNSYSQSSSYFCRDMDKDKEDIKEDKQTDNLFQPTSYNEYI